MTIHYHTKHFHETPYSLKAYMLLLLIDQLSLETKYFRPSDLVAIGSQELKSTSRTMYRELNSLLVAGDLMKTDNGLYYLPLNH